jgi:hypothetical protein
MCGHCPVQHQRDPAPQQRLWPCEDWRTDRKRLVARVAAAEVFKPEWLSSQFEDTEVDISLDERKHKLTPDHEVGVGGGSHG